MDNLDYVTIRNYCLSKGLIRKWHGQWQIEGWYFQINNEQNTCIQNVWTSPINQ